MKVLVDHTRDTTRPNDKREVSLGPLSRGSFISPYDAPSARRPVGVVLRRFEFRSNNRALHGNVARQPAKHSRGLLCAAGSLSWFESLLAALFLSSQSAGGC